MLAVSRVPQDCSYSTRSCSRSMPAEPLLDQALVQTLGISAARNGGHAGASLASRSEMLVLAFGH